MTTPITFLFNDDATLGIDWPSLLTVYPALQQKRLSWRESDPRFASFLSFLETDGIQSELTETTWRDALAEHLAYPSNQHFLFMLWQSFLKRTEENSGAIELAWLPDTLAARFAHWHKQLQLDRSLLSALDNTCQSGDSSIFPAFRGTPLSSAFMYQTLQAMVAGQAHQSNAQESQ
ncbi:hypothetical protein [Rhodocyclus tenuis]|uniref:Uncharacterized protein n=1 Tax=Rhodocyclus tenuis TaxID=1066 RepID=A0A840FXX3_RHOTE|nr:hypothetical protein [Rhodocyclus tenuis]MBB4246664.1 hypothetical protein [Rhodocyclus tenuis]